MGNLAVVTLNPMPAWPLPVMALIQVFVGTAFMAPLGERDTEQGAGYSALAVIGGLIGLALWVLAVRNCALLWRVEPREASWAIVAATGLAVLCSAVWVIGPASSGVWHWESIVHAALAAYLAVVLVREVSRRVSLRKAPGSQSALESVMH